MLKWRCPGRVTGATSLQLVSLVFPDPSSGYVDVKITKRAPLALLLLLMMN
jgi:hypothetical protein